MTKFADRLFDDLMREHGPALASITVPAAPKRHLAVRPVLLTAGAGGLAVAAAVGTLVAGGGTPAYAVTTHPDGTVTLAVYQPSGIAQANAELHTLGDRVVVVPVRSGCPSIGSLRAPAVPAGQISVQASGSSNGTVTVAAQGVPAGDVLVLGFTQTTTGQFSMQETTAGPGTSGQAHGSVAGQGQGIVNGHPPVATAGSSRLTSEPVPSCVSIPAPPPGARNKSGATSCTHSAAAPSAGGIPVGMAASAPAGPPTSRPVAGQKNPGPAGLGGKSGVSCSGGVVRAAAGGAGPGAYSNG
jgi:hypothetical protein